MGLRRKLFQVIKSFVVGRRQQVRVGHSLSKEFLATSGVPQGSILSPLLFLIFINELSDLCKVVYPLLFADDAKFLCVGLDTKAIQNNLNNIFNWTLSNEMPFNMEKCAHIAIPNKNKELFFGNARIEPALTQLDLGLYFSGDLKWNLYIDKVCGKANQVFQMIKKMCSLFRRMQN